MKKRYTFIIFILAIFCFNFIISNVDFGRNTSTYVSTKQNGYKLTLSIDKDSYKFGDPIEVTSTVANTSLFPKFFVSGNGCDNRSPHISLDTLSNKFYSDDIDVCTNDIKKILIMPGQTKTSKQIFKVRPTKNEYNKKEAQAKKNPVFIFYMPSPLEKKYSGEELNVHSRFKNVKVSILIPFENKNQ